MEFKGGVRYGGEDEPGQDLLESSVFSLSERVVERSKVQERCAKLARGEF